MNERRVFNGRLHTGAEVDTTLDHVTTAAEKPPDHDVMSLHRARVAPSRRP